MFCSVQMTLVAENKDLVRCIEDIETYTRREQVIIRGLPEGSFSELATRSNDKDATKQHKSSAAVEQTVIQFCKEKVHIDICGKDISNVHHLRKGRKDTHRPIIVRFVMKKVQDSVT